MEIMTLYLAICDLFLIGFLYVHARIDNANPSLAPYSFPYAFDDTFCESTIHYDPVGRIRTPALKPIE